MLLDPSEKQMMQSVGSRYGAISRLNREMHAAVSFWKMYVRDPKIFGLSYLFPTAGRKDEIVT